MCDFRDSFLGCGFFFDVEATEIYFLLVGKQNPRGRVVFLRGTLIPKQAPLFELLPAGVNPYMECEFHRRRYDVSVFAYVDVRDIILPPDCQIFVLPSLSFVGDTLVTVHEPILCEDFVFGLPRRPPPQRKKADKTTVPKFEVDWLTKLREQWPWLTQADIKRFLQPDPPRGGVQDLHQEGVQLIHQQRVQIYQRRMLWLFMRGS